LYSPALAARSIYVTVEPKSDFVKQSFYGPILEKERLRNDKELISGALLDIGLYLRPIVDGILAKQKAPVPDDPAVLARHVKELVYFLRIDGRRDGRGSLDNPERVTSDELPYFIRWPVLQAALSSKPHRVSCCQGPDDAAAHYRT